MVQAAERGKVVLGGCCVEPGAARWQCRVCGQIPGQPMDWTGSDGPRHGEFGYHHRVLVAREVPTQDASEPVLIDFALTFDGYAAFGVTHVSRIDVAARKQYEKSGKLPKNLAVLRACLFFEQRAARFPDEPFGGPFVFALVDAIRSAAAEET
jgi:hypothetical protein